MDEKTFIKLIETQEKAATALAEVTKNQTELINKMILEIEERANIAKWFRTLFYIMLGFVLIVIVAMTVQQIVWLYPAMTDNKIEIREVATGKLFEVIK